MTCLNPKLKLFSLRTAAAILLVSPHTLKRWARLGLIESRRQLLSGCAFRLVFSEAELLRFIHENMPTSDDLESFHPRSERAARIKRIVAVHRGYLGKAAAANAARRYGKLR